MVPFSITYQRGYLKGTRPLFAAAKRVLSPPGVEGAFLMTSTKQEQDRGKEPMHEEGPSGEPSGAQGTGVILILDQEREAENAKLRMIIQKQDTEIKDLIPNFERSIWVIKYLEQRNKKARRLACDHGAAKHP